MKRLLVLLSIVFLIYFTVVIYQLIVLADPRPVATSTARSFYLSKFDVAKVESTFPCGFTADRLRIRASASTESEIRDVLPAMTNICFTETIEVEGNEWGHLQDSEDYPSGWVFMNFVNMDSTYSPQSYTLVDRNPSRDCWFDKYPMEVVSPQLISINRHYTNFTLEELEKFDTLVAQTMGVKLKPAFIWWLKFPEIELTRPFLRDYVKPWEGLQTDWSWDGCNLVPIGTDVVSLTLVVTEYGETNALGTYLHERAHSLGAVHGRAGLKHGIKLEIDIEGPNDAYWWTDIGRFASMGTCALYDADTIERTTCSSISNIIN